MKHSLKMFIGIFIVVLLTGCIGENYDFSPPTVTIASPDNLYQSVELTEANIKWYTAEQYNKETADVQKLAKKQTPMYFSPGQNVEYSLEDGFFEQDNISVSVLKDGIETELKLEAVQSFTLQLLPVLTAPIVLESL